MSLADWILIGTTVLAWYHVGFVWLVQVVAWPLFAYVGPNEFPAYHQAWWRGIRYILFIPSGLAFLGGLALVWLRPANMPYWLLVLAFAMYVVMYLVTAAWWGPQQARLTTPDAARIAFINRTHWLRTALVSAYALAWLAALVIRFAA